MTAPCLPEQKTQLENKDRQIANLKAKMGGGGGDKPKGRTAGKGEKRDKPGGGGAAAGGKADDVKLSPEAMAKIAKILKGE